MKRSFWISIIIISVFLIIGIILLNSAVTNNIISYKSGGLPILNPMIKRQDHRIPERVLSDIEERLLQPYAWYWNYDDKEYWRWQPTLNVTRFQTAGEHPWTSLRPNWWPEWILRTDMYLAIKPNKNSCEWDVQRVRCEPSIENKVDDSMWVYNKIVGSSRVKDQMDDTWRTDWREPRFKSTGKWGNLDSYRVNYLLWVYKTTPASYFPKTNSSGDCISSLEKKKLDDIWDSLAGFHFMYSTEEGLTETNIGWRLNSEKPWPITYQGNTETTPIWINNDIASMSSQLVLDTKVSIGGGRQHKTDVYAWPGVTALYSYTAAMPNEVNGGVPSPYWMDYQSSPIGCGKFGCTQKVPTDFFYALKSRYVQELFTKDFKSKFLGGAGENNIPNALTLPGDYQIKMQDPVKDFTYQQKNYMEVTRGGAVDIWLPTDHPRFEGSYGYMLQGAGTFYPMRGKKKNATGEIVRGDMLVAVSKFHACLMVGMSEGQAVRNTASTILPIVQEAVRMNMGPNNIINSGNSFLSNLLNYEAEWNVVYKYRGEAAKYFVSTTSEGRKLGCGFNGFKNGAQSVLEIQMKSAQELEKDPIFGPAMHQFCLRHASGLYSAPIYGTTYNAIGDSEHSLDGYAGNIAWTYESGGTSFPRPAWDEQKMNDIDYVPSESDLQMMNKHPETSIIIDKTHYYSEMALTNGVAKELGKPRSGRIDSIITIFEGEPGHFGFLGKVDSEMQSINTLPEMTMNFCWLNPVWVKENRYGLYDYDTGKCDMCQCKNSHGLKANGETNCPSPVIVQVGSKYRDYPDNLKTINAYKPIKNPFKKNELISNLPLYSTSVPKTKETVTLPPINKSLLQIMRDAQPNNNS